MHKYEIKHYTLQLNIFQNDDELLLKGLIIILEIFFQVFAAGDAIKQGCNKKRKEKLYHS